MQYGGTRYGRSDDLKIYLCPDKDELTKAIVDSVVGARFGSPDMHPFVVTDETKAMVSSNIAHLLNGFLACFCQ
jgi:hypothetical protein